MNVIIDNSRLEQEYIWMKLIKDSLGVNFNNFTLNQNELNKMTTIYNELFKDTTNTINPKGYFEIPPNVKANRGGYKFDYQNLLNHYKYYNTLGFDKDSLYKFFCFVIVNLKNLNQNWVNEILNVNLNYPNTFNYISNSDTAYEIHRKYYSISELFETMVLWFNNNKNISIEKTPYINKDYKFSYINLKENTSLFKSLNFKQNNPTLNWRKLNKQDRSIARAFLTTTDNYNDYSWFSMNPRKSKVYMFDFSENDDTFRHPFIGLYKTQKNLKLFNLNDLDNIKKLLNFLSELKAIKTKSRLETSLSTYDFGKYYDIDAKRKLQQNTISDEDILSRYIVFIKTILYDYDYEKLYRTSTFAQDKMMVHSIELLNKYKGFEFDGYMGGVLDKGKNWCGFETEMGLLPNIQGNFKTRIQIVYHNSDIQPITRYRLYDFVDHSCWSDKPNISLILEPKEPNPKNLKVQNIMDMDMNKINLLEPSVYTKEINKVLGNGINPPYKVTEISEYYKELYTMGKIPNRIIDFNAYLGGDIKIENDDPRWSNPYGCKQKNGETVEEYLIRSRRYYLDQTNARSDKMRLNSGFISVSNYTNTYGKNTYLDRINRMNFYSINNFNDLDANKNYMTKYLKVFCKQLFENISMNPYTGCNSDNINVNRPNHGGLNHLRSVSMAIKLISIIQRKNNLYNYLFESLLVNNYYPNSEMFNILFLVCASFMKSLMRIDETSPIHIFYGPSSKDQNKFQFERWKQIWGDLDIDEFLLNATSIQLQGFASATLFKSIMMKTIGNLFKNRSGNYYKNITKHINTVAFSLCYYPELHLRHNIDINNPKHNNIKHYKEYTTLDYLNNKYYNKKFPSKDKKHWINQFILNDKNKSERDFFATLGITCTPHYMDHIRGDFSDNIFSDYGQFYRGTADTTPQEEIEIVNFAISNIIKTEYNNKLTDDRIAFISNKYVNSYYSTDRTPIIKLPQTYLYINNEFDIPKYTKNIKNIKNSRKECIRIITLINSYYKFDITKFRYQGNFKELSEDFDKCYKFLNIEEDFKNLFK